MAPAAVMTSTTRNASRGENRAKRRRRLRDDRRRGSLGRTPIRDAAAPSANARFCVRLAGRAGVSRSGGAPRGGQASGARTSAPSVIPSFEPRLRPRAKRRNRPDCQIVTGFSLHSRAERGGEGWTRERDQHSPDRYGLRSCPLGERCCSSPPRRRRSRGCAGRAR